MGPVAREAQQRAAHRHFHDADRGYRHVDAVAEAPGVEQGLTCAGNSMSSRFPIIQGKAAMTKRRSQSPARLHNRLGAHRCGRLWAGRCTSAFRCRFECRKMASIGRNQALFFWLIDGPTGVRLLQRRLECCILSK